MTIEAEREMERGEGIPLMRQCIGFTRDGSRCSRSAEGPNGWCYAHDPARAGMPTPLGPGQSEFSCRILDMGFREFLFSAVDE